jgi:hypothetical protein
MTDHSETGMSDDHRLEQLPTEVYLTAHSQRVLSISNPQSPEAQSPFPGSSEHVIRRRGKDRHFDTSVGVKYVMLCLCFNRELFQIKIVIENAHWWDDREVMQKIEQAYWKARGAWKKWPTEWRIWPWKVLHKMGYVKVNGISGRKLICIR